MNLFQLVFKQMRQRALSTWLTLLTVLLGVGLAISIMVLRRGSAQLFVQSDFGYEVIIGAPQSSPLNLVLNTAYGMGVSGGTMPYQLYEDMIRDVPVKNRPFFGRQVKVAVPFMVGDSYRGRRIIGTTGAMFGFDDDGDPIAGYDSRGLVMKGFEDPDNRNPDPTKPKAAPAFEYRSGRKYVLAENPTTGKVDVTDKVKSHLQDNALTIKATNENFSDPAVGISKELQVDYTLNGVAHSITVGEGATLSISGKPSTLAIVKAVWGDLPVNRCLRANRFEAVIGSDVASSLHLRLYKEHLADAEIEAEDARRAAGMADEQKRVGRALTTEEKAPFEPLTKDEKRKMTELKNEVQGRAFRATHGFPAPNQKPDIHKPIWHVVGILEPTHTAGDRALFVSLVSLYAIEEHEIGMISQAMARANIDPSRVKPNEWQQVLRQLGFDPEKMTPSVMKELKKLGVTTKPTSAPATALSTTSPTTATAATAPATVATTKAADEDEDAYRLDDNGEIIPELPKEEWRVNAILVRTRGGNTTGELEDVFRTSHPEAQAVAPAPVMVEFFNTFFKTSVQVLLIISLLVTIVAAVGILVSIYNSVAARMREIAILRALGATRGKVLTMICCEAGLIGLFGGIAGLATGHLIGAIESKYFVEWCGQGFDWMSIGWSDEWYANEPLYLLFVVVVAAFAGLVPAMKAYRSPVATNLVAG